MYHLDQPAAGPGAFPQFVVAGQASRRRRVVLAGQGGDEVFGGYVRYLVACFEQASQAALEGDERARARSEAMLPNLAALHEYQPLLRESARGGPVEDLDLRYLRLIDRSASFRGEVDWEALGSYSPRETFRQHFRAAGQGQLSDLDTMTHFDARTLLPALLHVEDRVSMAHGLEARVPLLDHRLVELAATIPAALKFRDGDLKHLFRSATADLLPASIVARRDKMGFPVPLHEWLGRPGAVAGFVRDVLSTRRAQERDFVDNRLALERCADEPRFGRRSWGLLCLELWQQAFHDRARHFRTLLADADGAGTGPPGLEAR